VTVGGAIANDVHGKNHHRAGTFGRHVLRIALERSDRPRTACSRDAGRDLFSATIGGLGLTGLVLWADLQLRRISSRRVHLETFRFGCLDEFYSLSDESDATHEYTVAWVDCTARGAALGRGWFFRGNHATEEDPVLASSRGPGLNFRLNPPCSLVNRATVKAFNALYYYRPVRRMRTVDFEPFFYPLDAIRNWNRAYGPQGFYQFQCVIPREACGEGLPDLLRQTEDHGQGSFLTVLKMFGDLESPGVLSFPRPGATLAIDFPNRGKPTRELLARLEEITLDAGGAFYPGKDAVMSPSAFQLSYPDWERLEAQRDPRISSNFWRRVTGP
jgi:FAD/FMN-containing dehydrogenase